MRSAIAVLPLAILALSLGAGRSLAAGVAVGVEVGGGAAAPAGAELNEAQLKQVAAATGQADLVAVIKVTEVSEPKKDDAADKKDDAEAKPNVLGLGVVRMGGGMGGTEKLVSAEVTEVLRGDKEVKAVRIQASTFKNGATEMMLVNLDQEWKDPNGAMVRRFSRQTTVPFTLAKDKTALVFLKAVENKKGDDGKDAGDAKPAVRLYKLVLPLLDGVPEKALAAAREAVKRLADWDNPPKLSAEDQAAVEKLVKELGSDDYATREAATKALSAKGPAIKPLMEAAAKGSADPEVKQRAGQVLEAIKPESLKPPDPSAGFGSGGGVIMMQNGVQVQVQGGM
ncbi:MAG TPA: HEAT repeat domain-containing protein [Planctomycetota bacterium]|nr:HEAT repeat domain-containing protein [Planctomycetota bacterium]